MEFLNRLALFCGCGMVHICSVVVEGLQAQ